MTTQTPDLTTGSIGRIPVRNIWLLLLYASRLYRELPASRRVEMEDAPDDIPYLVAEILAGAAGRRLRRSLSHGYRRRRADLNRVRGRVDLFRTERLQLLRRGRVACTFDELTVDTPRNRCVKTALRHMADVVGRSAGHADLARRCRDLALRLERAGVTGRIGSRDAARAAATDGAGWVDADERQMLAAAMLALNPLIPTGRSGAALLPAVDRSEVAGWRLYEEAVAGFYAVALSDQGWRVKPGGRIQWPATDPTPGLDAIMPRMITDIVLERRGGGTPAAGRRIVIDTKFTSIVGAGRFGGRRLKSPNIYQLYAYLRSQERPDDPMSCHSTGVLLYPSLGDGYDESAVVQGHRMRFATVDLASDARTVRDQLLRVVDS